MESEAGSAPESAMLVRKMVKIEAAQEKTRLFVVTSSYLVPFTYWCFKTVAKLMKIDRLIDRDRLCGLWLPLASETRIALMCLSDSTIIKRQIFSRFVK